MRIKYIELSEKEKEFVNTFSMGLILGIGIGIMTLMIILNKNGCFN